jgi:hypothetical protein
LFFILNTTRRYNNCTEILAWVTQLNYSQFDIFMEKVSKKYKKKNKKRYLYKIQYLSKNKQLCGVMKWIHLTNNNFNAHSFKQQWLLNVLDLLLNFKQSKLFLKKIFIYKNFLKL